MTTPTKDIPHIQQDRVGPSTSTERKTISQEKAARELALDLLHQSLESDPRPDETVMLMMLNPEGKRVGLILPSLHDRKRIYSSAEERRELLSLLLAAAVRV
jgi:hypothetical protein